MCVSELSMFDVRIIYVCVSELSTVDVRIIYVSVLQLSESYFGNLCVLQLSTSCF
jgi:hypothetical protein